MAKVPLPHRIAAMSRAHSKAAAFEVPNIEGYPPCGKAADGSLTIMDSQGNSELQPGDVLQAGRYEITELLRPARDKNVYLAQDRVLDCKVTVDVFSNNSSIMPGGLTVSAWEASVLGQLGNHPNIATVLHYWEDEKTATMVSRYLPGGKLRDVIERSQESGGRLPVERILQFSTEIARGLEHIHGRRILYRDLQPCNVLLDEWGAVHLVDFDTAVSLDDHDMSDLSQRPVIAYTAPELTDGGSADERADLYSLGATIYEMAGGASALYRDPGGDLGCPPCRPAPSS